MENNTKIQLYIASSLDGYIAREDGSVAWLEELEGDEGTDYGYGEFIANIDMIIMGRKTYDLVLGFDMPWPYKEFETYVATSDRNLKVSTPNTHLIHDLNKKSIRELRDKSNKNIWLIGGGELVSLFLELGETDEYIICLIPRVLGKGIPLFPRDNTDTKLTLSDCKSYKSGAVMLRYLKAG